MKGLLSPLLVLLCACSPALDEEALETVRGKWVTAERRYEDRFFEFTEERGLRLGLGGDTVSENEIEALVVTPMIGEGSAYELGYVDNEGVESVFRFRYERSKDVIRFVNQDDMFWTRWTP